MWDFETFGLLLILGIVGLFRAAREKLFLTILAFFPFLVINKAHPAVPGWSICSIRVPCAGDLRRARGGTGWLGGDC